MNIADLSDISSQYIHIFIRKIKLPLFSKLLCLILLALGVSISQTTYYVDTTGNDSNNGTSPSTAWKSLRRVMQAIQSSGTGAITWRAGDSLLFKYGQTWEPTTVLSGEGVLRLPVGKYKGTVARPIVWGAYGDPLLGRPILCMKNCYRLAGKLIYAGMFKNWRLENIELHGDITMYSSSLNDSTDGLTWYNLYFNGSVAYAEGWGNLSNGGHRPYNYMNEWTGCVADPNNAHIYHYAHANNVHISHCQFDYWYHCYDGASTYRNLYFGHNTGREIYCSFFTAAQGHNITFEYNSVINQNINNFNNYPFGGITKIENQRWSCDSVIYRGNLLCGITTAWMNLFQSVGIDNLQCYNNTFVGMAGNSQISIGWQREHTTDLNRYSMWQDSGRFKPYSNSFFKNNIIIGRPQFISLDNHHTLTKYGVTWSLTFDPDTLFRHGLDFQHNSIFNRNGGSTHIGNTTLANWYEHWDENAVGRNGVRGYYIIDANGESGYGIATTANFKTSWNTAHGFTDTCAVPAFASGSADTSGFRLEAGNWATTYGEAIPGYIHDLSGNPVPQTGAISIGCFQGESWAPVPPKLASPSNGAMNVPDSAKLSWDSVYSATAYHLQIATDTIFMMKAVDDSTIISSSKQVGSLSTNTRYYWRVRAKNISGYTPFSGTYNFMTAGVNGVQQSAQLPDKYSMEQNYPNPFNPSTKIRFTVIDSRFTTLKVYDVLGQEMATLVNEVKQPGEYTVQLDASAGGSLPSGIYFYKLQSGSFADVKKMLLLR